MRGVILQPTYLPWLGYFEMINSADIYIAFDHVQFVRKSWHHRNRIKGANGAIWLTVPVQQTGRTTRICDAKIAYGQGNMLEKHWLTIQHVYNKSRFFQDYKPLFEKIYSINYEYLSQLNIEIIKTILHILGKKIKFVCSSTLNLHDENLGKTEKIVHLCKEVGITSLYDANSAATFLDTSLFKKEGIGIEFQNFNHPVYRQLWGDFFPYMSIVDLLFNEGDKSLAIIKSGSNRDAGN